MVDSYEKKHPHVRGEDRNLTKQGIDKAETPPRAWGRLKSPDLIASKIWKHPHVRGEDPYLWGLAFEWLKHPHVRGEDTERLLTFFIEPSKQY